MVSVVTGFLEVSQIGNSARFVKRALGRECRGAVWSVGERCGV